MRITLMLVVVSLLFACSGGGGGDPDLSDDGIQSVQPAPTPSDSGSPPNVNTVDNAGTTAIQAGDLSNQLDLIPLTTIDTIEAAELAYMREEEKLAYDLYIKLYQIWGQRVFDNIAAAELTHTSAVLALLNRYEIADPASTEAGVFNNIDLQNLYDFLLASGSNSFIDALLAAATVEEVDILDLETYLLHVEGSDDIVLVYENLLAGSRNHLRSFVSNLENQGISYSPVHLEQAAYDAIIQSEMEK